jgi:hypothetical protein
MGRNLLPQTSYWFEPKLTGIKGRNKEKDTVWNLYASKFQCSMLQYPNASMKAEHEGSILKILETVPERNARAVFMAVGIKVCFDAKFHSGQYTKHYASLDAGISVNGILAVTTGIEPSADLDVLRAVSASHIEKSKLNKMARVNAYSLCSIV